VASGKSGLPQIIYALFLLFLFTDSYAAISEQQSFPLLTDVASGKSGLPQIIYALFLLFL
jgi:hypothetical protein